MTRKMNYGAYAFFYILFLSLIMLAVLIADQLVAKTSAVQPVAARTCIVVDAGHGGEDGGAISCTGVLESQVNLQIARRVRDLLGLLGYPTVMTRKSDAALHTEGSTIAARKASDLRNRVQLVNSTPGALLLSIHQNQFTDSRYSGAQVFYAQGESSETLAKQLQSALKEQFPNQSDRQAKRSTGVYLMEHVSCSAVLIECGFLSNPTEEALLRNDIYQKKLSAVICCTVSVYLDRRAVD